MKVLIVLSFIAALGALVLLPVSFELVVSLLASAGLLTTLFADYSRTFRPLPVPAASRVGAQRRERFRLAA